MTRFSQRMGLSPVRSVVQRESMDHGLRAKLWDAMGIYLIQTRTALRSSPSRSNYELVWTELFELPRDEIPYWSDDANAQLRRTVFEGEWWRVYDILEFMLAHCQPLRHHTVRVADAVNARLAQYLSAYRVVDRHVVELTDEQQVEAIEAALTTELSGVQRHLSKALAHIANRDAPDPANSVKESISAVESLCSAIVGKRSSLGDAIKKLQQAGVVLHPALVAGWSKMYGYTSDAAGIRHAMQDDVEVTSADALYFLVSCSAFISLLTQKAEDAQITLSAAN